MQSILDFLLAQGVIDEDRKAKLIYELKNSEPPTVDWSIQARMALFPPGSLNRRLAEIMVEKQSNLCLAVDGSSKERILQVSYDFPYKSVIVSYRLSKTRYK